MILLMKARRAKRAWNKTEENFIHCVIVQSQSTIYSCNASTVQFDGSVCLSLLFTGP